MPTIELLVPDRTLFTPYKKRSISFAYVNRPVAVHVEALAEKDFPIAVTLRGDSEHRLRFHDGALYVPFRQAPDEPVIRLEWLPDAFARMPSVRHGADGHLAHEAKQSRRLLCRDDELRVMTFKGRVEPDSSTMNEWVAGLQSAFVVLEGEVWQRMDAAPALVLKRTCDEDGVQVRTYVDPVGQARHGGDASPRIVSHRHRFALHRIDDPARMLPEDARNGLQWDGPAFEVHDDALVEAATGCASDLVAGDILHPHHLARDLGHAFRFGNVPDEMDASARIILDQRLPAFERCEAMTEFHRLAQGRPLSPALERIVQRLAPHAERWIEIERPRLDVVARDVSALDMV